MKENLPKRIAMLSMLPIMLMACSEEIPPVPTPKPTIETPTPEFQMIETDVMHQIAIVQPIVIFETATAMVGKGKDKND